MEQVNSSEAVPTNELYRQFIAYYPDGRYDIRTSVRQFEVSYLRWLLSQETLHPAILNELKTFTRLGEGKLISFVLHALQLAPEKPNIDRVRFAIKELANMGKIVFHETDSGSHRGRTVGWMIAPKKTVSGVMSKVEVPEAKTGT